MNAFLHRRRVLLLHLSFWCAYLSFFIYQSSVYSHRRGDEDLGRAVTFALVHVAFTAGVAYLNYFVFLPRFLARQRLGAYLLEFLPAFGLLLVGRVYFQRWLVDGFAQREGYFYSNLFVVQLVATTLLMTIFVGMLRFAVEWFELESKKKEIANERLMAELNFLKAQINPHFLFNTLNNLYYLAYSHSPNTTEVIAKLSQMMRYMIYDSNHPQVLLSKEIEYMESYISLEKLRLNDAIPITFTVRGNPQGVRIVPLILITFLENAFKHGVTNNQPDAWVHLTLDIRGGVCTYEVANSRPAHATAGEKSGIGLQNVQRRLDLSYPDKYHLTVEDQPTRYRVALELEVS